MTESFTITVEPLGRDIECREDQTILDACLRSGVWLPHSCTHGTCATCKVEVLDGEVDHGGSTSFALMDFERDEGKTLVCCAFPRSDVTIEADIDVDEDIEVHPVEDYVGTIVALDDIAIDTKRVVVEVDRDLKFNAGQYMKFMVPAEVAAGKRVDRTYSIANAPTENRRIEFQIRRTAGGLATDGWIFSTLAVGDTVNLAGPYGRFVLHTGNDNDVVMIAGGTGLAPIASMIKHALINGEYDGHITLYQGGRTREWLYDVEMFRELEEEHSDQFTYRPCVSGDEGEPDDLVGYAIGRVNEVLEADHSSLKGYNAYVCGSPAMVESTLKSLMSRRLFPRDIFREDFFDESDKATGGVKSPLIKR
jgi:phenol/toluene 2-monooxygenase (NADH) P5/A5